MERALPILMVAFAFALLPACARPADRIATSLTAYGVPEARAVCVGERLQRDLSISQLRQLSALVRAYRAEDPNPDRLTGEDFLRVASRVRDPQVPLAAARAAASCGLLY